ncbi:hypothetical protein NEOLEDRAFT_393767 [Neolentinus lepideus HHB14362 ss-1]|uniref:Secreted protein n=1 Tax=Neolentinus lepideus HHB14362 ss-1 TaxID=1314782 RepID=A0A165S833_9AGAM|nr:hypothetical protein NEOLEDRAFT_393767 [Neolentinus lepideus HHB14362 ss-1]
MPFYRATITIVLMSGFPVLHSLVSSCKFLHPSFIRASEDDGLFTALRPALHSTDSESPSASYLNVIVGYLLTFWRLGRSICSA